MAERTYQRISNENYALVVAAIERGTPIGDIAVMLDVKLKTVYTIRRRYEMTGRAERLPRGGKTHVKMTEDIVQHLVSRLDENPLLTLQQLRDHLVQTVGVEFQGLALSTISRSLDRRLITLKMLTKGSDVREARNCPENIELRRQFAHWATTLPEDANLIFLDECGFNLWTSRHQGRAPRGAPVRRQVHTQRGATVTVTLAISPTAGLLHSSFLAETMTAARFQEFLNQLCQTVAEELEEAAHCVIVLDGARVHSQATVPPAFSHRIQMMTLPPYSPFLNPTEQAISCFKASIKRQLADPEVQDELSAPPEAMNLTQWRVAVLQRCAVEAIGSITAAKCSRWHQHTMRYLPRCLNGEEVL